MGCGWSGLPVDKPLWGIVDVYGKCSKIKAHILSDGMSFCMYVWYHNHSGASWAYMNIKRLLMIASDKLVMQTWWVPDLLCVPAFPADELALPQIHVCAIDTLYRGN